MVLNWRDLNICLAKIWLANCHHAIKCKILFELPLAGNDFRLCRDLPVQSLRVWTGLRSSVSGKESWWAQSARFWPQVCAVWSRSTEVLPQNAAETEDDVWSNWSWGWTETTQTLVMWTESASVACHFIMQLSISTWAFISTHTGSFCHAKIPTLRR